MELRFEWDSNKATTNVAKHGVSFDEAREVFPESVISNEVETADHSINEIRMLIIGVSNRGRLLVVSHTVDDGRIRLIGAGHPPRASGSNMKKTSAKPAVEAEEMPEVDFSKGVRGKVLQSTEPQW